MRLIRLLFYAAAGYLVFRIGFPDEAPHTTYHAITVPLLLGGAVGVFLLLKAIDIGSKTAALAIELAFAGGVALYLGFTMPQTKGKAPLMQLLSGEVPRRATARDGLRKLGVDPESAPAKLLTKLFPE
jgi:hypothetical protein